MPESVERLPAFDLGFRWWLNFDYRGGVARRIGWWVSDGKYRTHWYVVTFNDGTRSHAQIGTNPIELV